MRGGQPDIFVEMKQLNRAPSDAGLPRERVDKLELRVPGRSEDPRTAFRCDRAADDLASVCRRRPAQREFIGETS